MENKKQLWGHAWEGAGSWRPLTWPARNHFAGGSGRGGGCPPWGTDPPVPSLGGEQGAGLEPHS